MRPPFRVRSSLTRETNPSTLSMACEALLLGLVLVIGALVLFGYWAAGVGWRVFCLPARLMSRKGWHA